MKFRGYEIRKPIQHKSNQNPAQIQQETVSLDCFCDSGLGGFWGIMSIHISEKTAKEILGPNYKSPPKERQPRTERKFCIYCKELVKITGESSGCEPIPGTNPVEVQCFHLDCEKT